MIVAAVLDGKPASQFKTQQEYNEEVDLPLVHPQSGKEIEVALATKNINVCGILMSDSCDHYDRNGHRRHCCLHSYRFDITTEE